MRLVIGEMLTDLTTAQIALQSMVANANELDLEPGIEHANRALIRKTIVAEAVKHTTSKALEATGGAGYFRRFGLERILRDAQAAQFHPMPAKKQHRFTGRLAMGLDPLCAVGAAKRISRCCRGSIVSRAEPSRELLTNVSWRRQASTSLD